jgi:hypothetical protein
MIIGGRAIELSPILVPYSVPAIFSARYDYMIARVPVTVQHDAIVSLPGQRLVTRESRNNSEVLIAAVEKRITLWAPYNTINGFASLNDCRPKHATS